MADTNPVVSALAAYIEQRDFPLVGAIQFNPSMTAADATVQSGVKGSSDLHFLSTTVNFLDGSGCDTPTPTDVSTFAKKTLTVAEIDVAESWCLDLLKGKWTQILLKKGTLLGKQVMPEEIASVYWEQKNTLMSEKLDTADWQGDTDSVVGNLNKYDGWIKWIAAGNAVQGNTLGITISTGFTVANALAIMDAMYLVVPLNIQSKTDLKWYMPIEWTRIYVVALKNANLFHYTSTEGDLKFYGTDITIRPTYGLVGTNKMYITYGENLVLGIDGENDTEFEIGPDPLSPKRRLLVEASFTRGTQVQFVEDVVEFVLGVS